MYKRSLLVSCISAIGLIACSSSQQKEAQGYLEGTYAYIASPVSGRLSHFYVDKGAMVKPGELLAVLEQEPALSVYKKAQAALNQALSAEKASEANLTYAQVNLQRNEKLAKKNIVHQDEIDHLKANTAALAAQAKQAKAVVEAAQAALTEAAWQLNQKSIYAPPIRALVFDRYYQIGEYVKEGQPVFSLLLPNQMKAIFYVNETALGSLHLQDKVRISCDGCSTTYQGQIEFISAAAEYTPPVIFSRETNAKLVYRIEAHIVTSNAYQLHPGQPVLVNFTVNGRSTHAK